MDGLLTNIRNGALIPLEDHNVVVMYASIYGNTENAADVLAGRLADAGEKNVKVYDVSVTDPSYLVAEAFRCDRIVFACPTYNAGLFPKMETLLHELAAHNLQKRKSGSSGKRYLGFYCR